MQIEIEKLPLNLEIEQLALQEDILDKNNLNLLYVLKKDFEFTLKIDGTFKNFIIKKGFEFDSASIPQIFWGFYSPTQLIFLISGLIHDYFYRDFAENKDRSRKFADLVFKKCLEVLFENENKNIQKLITPKICYLSVRIFAGKYFKINDKLTII